MPYVMYPAIFTKKTKGGIIILIVHVDDILVMRSDESGIPATKDLLQKHLGIYDLGIPCYDFVGINIY